MVPMTRPLFRIMTVCTGNICRSPMAEAVLRARLAEAGLGSVAIDSTGISDEEVGNPLDRRAAAVLQEHGYDPLPGHRARQLDAAQLLERDLVIPMTTQHARVVRRLAARAGASPTVRMMRSFDPAETEGDSVVRNALGGTPLSDDLSMRDGLAVLDTVDVPLEDGVSPIRTFEDRTAWDIADPWYGGREDFELALAQIEAAASGVVAQLRQGVLSR